MPDVKSLCQTTCTLHCSLNIMFVCNDWWVDQCYGPAVAGGGCSSGTFFATAPPTCPDDQHSIWLDLVRMLKQQTTQVF